MLECVVNVSEGRDRAVLDALSAACGPALLDRHVDADHHRSVFTLGSADPGATEAAARRLATVAAEDLSGEAHDGVHPRLGALDVVPFVALAPTEPDTAVAAARGFAAWIARTHAIPAFLYDDADPEHRSLPETRRDAFTVRRPDVGPAVPHPSLGAVAVGARPPLVALNVELDRDDLALARAVAGAVRARDGGLPGVRALGLALRSRHRSQVSMNLVDLDVIDIETAVREVQRLLAAGGAGVGRVELVGLVPAGALALAAPAFLAWSRISEEQTIEARVARADGGGSGARREPDPASPA